MSSAAIHLPPAPSSEPIFRLSVAQYHAMIETGVLTDDDPVELLEGILVFKMPKKPGHRIALAKIQRAISPLLLSRLSLQVQEPITLADGEPEPDAATIRGQAEDYPDRHPGLGDILLVIKVSDTTRATAGSSFAAMRGGGIPVYWIVDLIARAVEVYSDPDAAQSTFRRMNVARMGTSIEVMTGDQTLGTIAVSDIVQ